MALIVGHSQSSSDRSPAISRWLSPSRAVRCLRLRCVCCRLRPVRDPPKCPTRRAAQDILEASCHRSLSRHILESFQAGDAKIVRNVLIGRSLVVCGGARDFCGRGNIRRRCVGAIRPGPLIRLL